MESKKVNISIFNRYLILFIFSLFSYLFYLSLPTIYNYGLLQKDFNNKLLKEFNLISALSADITYKILPSPNSWPNNSFSYVESFSNEAFNMINGSFDLLESLCIFLATNSFPEPVGP